MDYSNYKKVTTSTESLKREAKEYHKLYIQDVNEDKIKLRNGFILFLGMILFGIIKFFIFGEESGKGPKGKKGKTKCGSVNFNFIKI